MARFEYTIDAFTQGPIGITGAIQVVVEADTEAGAIEKAKTIVHRDSYTVVRIRQLSEAIEKLMTTQTIEPVTLTAPNQTRKIKKG